MNHKEKLNYKQIFFINIITLLMGFSSALLLYINSTYFKEVLKSDNIGWTYLISNFLIILFLLNIHKIIKITGKTTLFQLLNILKISFFVSLIIFSNVFINTLSLMLFIVFDYLAWTLINMMLESFSIDKESGKIYGFNFTLFNLGFVLAPIISTELLNDFGFKSVFSLSLIITSILFIISLFKFKERKNKSNVNLNYKNIIKKIKERKDIQYIFTIAFSLYFFYALMVIYTPIYLINRGLTWNQIGIIFTIMLIPFILIQYPTGIIADNKIGEKELIFVSFIILGISTLIFYLTNSTKIITLATILFFSRVGAALIEILQSSYFYKRIDGRDIEIIAFFQIASPLAYILTPIITSLILIFFEMKVIFIFSSIVSFLTLYPVYKLTDNKSKSEI